MPKDLIGSGVGAMHDLAWPRDWAPQNRLRTVSQRPEGGNYVTVQARVIALHDMTSGTLLRTYQRYWHHFHGGCIVSPWHRFLTPSAGCRTLVTPTTPSAVRPCSSDRRKPACSGLSLGVAMEMLATSREKMRRKVCITRARYRATSARRLLTQAMSCSWCAAS